MDLKIEPFEKYTNRYEGWFTENRFAYESELAAVEQMIPKEGAGVEIGVGSALFAGPLGVRFGVDPSPAMLRIAAGRGIRAVYGIGEDLPYGGAKFDYALMVTTLCFLNDVHEAFREVFRVLKPGGCFINGFVDRTSRIGRMYEKNKEKSDFYRIARFYSIDEVMMHLKGAGFSHFEHVQTIFRFSSELTGIEPAKPGYGEGSFVVTKAVKEA